MEEERCEGRCHHKVNLCNDILFPFGRVECAQNPFTPLRTAGNTYLGYVVNEGKLTYIKITWEGEAFEDLVITRNGEPIETVSLRPDDNGVKCVKLREEFCDCDVLNVIEAAVPLTDQEPETFKAPCQISVVIEAEPKCDERFKREGDGLFEAYISDGSSVTIPTSWTTVDMDTVRVNTIPSYIAWNGSEATLKPGVYKIDYAMTIETHTSTSLNFSGRLRVNGASYPSSFNAAHILGGQGGDVSVGQGVTLVVAPGDTATVSLEAITDMDSSTNGNVDCNLIIERVKNSIDL